MIPYAPGILIFLAIFFAIWIVGGHLMWMALAWFIGLFAPPSHHQAVKPARPKPPVSPRPGKQADRPASDLQVTRRQIDLLVARGELDIETASRVLQALNRHHSTTPPPQTDALPAQASPPLAAPPAPSPAAVEPPVPVAPMVQPQKAASQRPVAAAQAPPPLEAGASAVPQRVPTPPSASQPTPAPMPSRAPAPPRPAVPRRGMGEIFAAFMDQSNIRWGELVGGLLIVVCSAALVISFWSSIADLWLVQVGLFTCVTAAIYAAGLYAHQRWRLPQTSRGLLMIATLLTPLTFLLISAFGQELAALDPRVMVVEVLALGLLGVLLFKGVGVYLPGWTLQVTGSVVTLCALQLLLRRWVTPSMSLPMLWLAAATPLLVYGLCMGSALYRSTRRPHLARRRMRSLLTLLGVSSFTVVTVVGLFVYLAGDVRTLATSLSTLVSLYGLPALVTGLLFQARRREAHLASLLLAASAVGVLGAAVMLVGVALAWPQPLYLLPALLLVAAVLTAIGCTMRLAAALAPAALLWVGGSLVVGLVIMRPELHWQLSDSAVMVRALLSGQSGMLLSPALWLLAALGWLLARAGRVPQGRCILVAALVLAPLSLLLLLVHGFARQGDPLGLAPLYAIHGLLLIVATLGVWHRQVHQRGATRPGPLVVTLAWAGVALWLLAILQACVYIFAWSGSTAWLAVASVATAGLLAAWLRPQAWRCFQMPALAAALLASLMVVSGFGQLFDQGSALDTQWIFSGQLLWIGLLWLLMAWVGGRRFAFLSAQAATALAVILAIGAWREAGLVSLSVVDWQASGLALWCMVWIALRMAIVRVRVPPSRMTGKGWLLGRPQEKALTRVLAERASWLLHGGRRGGMWAGLALDHLVLGGLLLFLLTGTWAGGLILAGEQWQGGFAYAHAEAARLTAVPGSGSLIWPLTGLVAVALMLSLGGGPRGAIRCVPLALVLLSLCLLPLLAAFWATELAVASALRWWAMAWVVGGVLMGPLRDIIGQRLRRTGQAHPFRGMEPWPRDLGARWALAVGGLTILLLSLVPFLRELTGGVVHGPQAPCIFAAMGKLVSHAVPLAVLSLALIAHGVLTRRDRWIYGGALVGNLTIAMVYLLGQMQQGPITEVHLIHMLALSTLWSAMVGLLWQIMTHARGGVIVQALPTTPFWQALQRGTALLGLVGFASPGLVAMFALPASAQEVTVAAGQPWGWAAWAVAMAMLWHMARWQSGMRWEAIIASTLGCLTLLGSVGMLAMTLAALNPVVAWRSLLVALAVVMWVGVAVTGFRRPVGRDPHDGPPSVAAGGQALSAWFVLTPLLLLTLVVRGLFSALDHQHWAVWYAVGPLLLVAGAFLTLAWLTGDPQRRRVLGAADGYLWPALGAQLLAVGLLWAMHWGDTLDPRAWLAGLLATQVLTLLPTAVLSFMLTRQGPVADRPVALPRAANGGWVHLVAPLLAIMGVAALLLVRMAGPALALDGWSLLHVAALGSALALTGLCLWDERGRYAPHGLYLLLIMTAALALDLSRPAQAWLAWWVVVGLGGVVFFSGLLWLGRSRWVARLRQLGICARPATGMGWLLLATFILATTQAVLVLRVVFGLVAAPDMAGALTATLWRVSAGGAPLLAAAGVVLLGVGLRPIVRATGLVGAGGALCLFFWSWVDPTGAWTSGVHYAAWAVIALGVALIAQSIALDRAVDRVWEARWAVALRMALTTLALGALAMLGVMLLLEVRHYLDDAQGPIPLGVAITVAVVLMALVALGIRRAVRAGADPLVGDAGYRVFYVYLAEVLLAVALLHVRLAMPWMFSGIFAAWWPLLIMVVAFAGLGLGAWFAQRGLVVLARPLAQTAMFLPLLPVLGFWLSDTPVHYSLLLVVVGLFYGAMAVNRRSFVLSVVAALAANGALWYVLQTSGRGGLLDHPQWWLVPLAVSVLVAAYLHREQLGPGRMTAVRYVCVSLIYLSSTAEIFIQGVAAAPWLPVVLMVLSVAGIMAGIMLRVQSFLFAGCAFLVLSLLTILYHASAHMGWIWVWYIAGIGLGLLIIFAFATFEHRRQQMLRRLDHLRQWER